LLVAFKNLIAKCLVYSSVSVFLEKGLLRMLLLCFF